LSAGKREYALGAAQPVDGYANGWRINSYCKVARMAFVPQHAANLALITSAVGALAMLLLTLGLRFPRSLLRRGASVAITEQIGLQAREVPAGAVRYGALTAAAWGVTVELLGAFMFAPRFGAVVGPLTFLLVLTGIGVRRLVLVGATGLAVVPLLYLIAPVSQSGGAAFFFSQDHLAAHWIAAGAILALAGAAGLQAHGLRSQHRRGRPRSPSHSDAGAQARVDAAEPQREHPVVTT